MRLSMPSFKFPFWTRNENGENFYDISTAENWFSQTSDLNLSLSHPILSGAMLFVSKLFSQAEFYIGESKDSNNSKKKNNLIDLLNNPNIYQTRQDFLETLMFVMMAQGVAVVGLEKVIGWNTPRSMHVLNKDLISWPDDFDKAKFKENDRGLLELKITYDKNGENIKYKLKDLLFFYDLPNGIGRNPFKVKSRVDGLRQVLINTHDSLSAKNIILKTNGKELITGKSNGFPLSPDDQQKIESLYNNKYGVSFNRVRGIVTKSELNHKSLHIALRDLGLDDSIKIDGNLIYTALHIPKDILSLEAKKTTYNNFKESMVSYVQNEMQPTLKSVISVFNKHFNNNNDVLNGDYDHLPIMQFVRLEKYKVIKSRVEALKIAREAGLQDQDALSLCGFDSNLVLNDIISNNFQNNGESEKEQ